jgi:hypothetical protein
VDVADIAGPLEIAEHPIPRIDTFDTVLTTDRGANLGIVIATPLRDDKCSKERLRRKMEMYLSYFQSPEYRDRCGYPLPDRSRIYVSIPAGSDASMLQLVHHYMSQMLSNGITPVLELTHSN